MAWQVPKVWEDGDCWIIGGGPSIVEQFNVPKEVVRQVFAGKATLETYAPYMEPIHDKHVIGINAAYVLGDWLDMVFFGDVKFYLMNRFRLAEFGRLKVSSHPKVNTPQYRDDKIKYLSRDKNHVKGISPHNDKVSWNGNSGAAAISLAAHTGVKRIYLLGFDMALNEEKQQQHWHNHYVKQNNGRVAAKRLPFARHLLGFPIIATDAKARGIEIINVNPNSNINEFEKVNLKDVI